MLLLLLACGGEPPLEADPALRPLPVGRLVTRLSLDLRGVRPTLAEYASVGIGPDPTAPPTVDDPAEAIDTLVEAWLEDPRFGEQVASVYADVLFSRKDKFQTSAAAQGLPDGPTYIQAVGEAPLRVIARIASEDLPWTEAVTGDWTMADETLAAIWPLDYPQGETGWKVAHWMDGRPRVGLLASTSLWWRYPSTESNANRGRANAISRIFLCNDYLARSITFDENLSLVDQEAVEEAVATSPPCLNCHASLDPLAANLFGFYVKHYEDPVDQDRYHPEREDDYARYLPVGPGYFGQPSEGLADLGGLIAADPRFVECPVEIVYGALLQRALTTDDTNALVHHRDAFLEGGTTFAALYRSVVSDPLYRAAPTDDPAVVGLKLARPDQLASTVEDLTGFRMQYLNWDLLRSDEHGYRLMAGGVDGLYALTQPTLPSPTVILVQERLAEAAAAYVTAADAALPVAERRLYTRVTFLETPTADPAAFTAEVQALALRVTGEPIAAGSEPHRALLDVWEATYAETGSPVDAWTALLAALLRDPALVMY